MRILIPFTLGSDKKLYCNFVVYDDQTILKVRLLNLIQLIQGNVTIGLPKVGEVKLRYIYP